MTCGISDGRRAAPGSFCAISAPNIAPRSTRYVLHSPLATVRQHGDCRRNLKKARFSGEGSPARPGRRSRQADGGSGRHRRLGGDACRVRDRRARGCRHVGVAVAYVTPRRSTRRPRSVVPPHTLSTAPRGLMRNTPDALDTAGTRREQQTADHRRGPGRTGPGPLPGRRPNGARRAG